MHWREGRLARASTGCFEIPSLPKRRWEIAENLHKADQSAMERSEHVAEWIRLTEKTEHSSRRDSRSPNDQNGRKIKTARICARHQRMVVLPQMPEEKCPMQAKQCCR